MDKRCKTCKEVKPLSEFRVKDGSRENQCRLCYNAYMRHWNAKNKEKVRKGHQLYKINNPEAFRNSVLKTLYGITLENYMKMLSAQGSVCAICNEDEVAIEYRTGNIRNLSVDHDKTTGEIRGLLCTRCNTALGLFRDSIKNLESAKQYLEKHGNKE